jgi:hypothetical protein
MGFPHNSLILNDLRLGPKPHILGRLAEAMRRADNFFRINKIENRVNLQLSLTPV